MVGVGQGRGEVWGGLWKRAILWGLWASFLSGNFFRN